jgi:hypothetical protein
MPCLPLLKPENGDVGEKERCLRMGVEK